MGNSISKSKSFGRGKAQDGKPAKPMAETAPLTFGSHLASEFPFDPTWKNLNHGSFGSIPNAILAQSRKYQDQCEARPDLFIRYDYPRLLDESRAAVAKLVNAPVETVVFVSNATEGVNTILRNLVWNDDGKDVIISFSTVYEACGKAADYLEDYFGGKVCTHEIPLEYPVEDEDVVAKFRGAVKELEAQGRRARVCIYDVVSSRPGVVFPWEAMTKACKDLGVISLVDGAQGIGMVHLDLSTVDPDYFVSNCHKWLHVPRGCAVFYVPERNQHLLPTTLSTSHGYVPKSRTRTSPLPPNPKSPFVRNFEFVGTKDNAPYLCVKDAIAWRRDVLGGEDRILKHLWDLNKKGSSRTAEILGTEVLNNSTGTMTNCAMANVAMPLWVGEAPKDGDAAVSKDESWDALQWIQKKLIDEYNTFLPVFIAQDRYWSRLSAQVYVGMEDYESVGHALKELSRRAGLKEYQKK